jgi:MoxR-like ATPase
MRLQDAALDVPLPKTVVQEILKLVNRTRPESELAGEHVKNYVAFGAGPRASQCLSRAVRALALLRGESMASVQEVRDLALPVLRHRIIPNYNATGEGVGVEEIVGKLVDGIEG